MFREGTSTKDILAQLRSKRGKGTQQRAIHHDEAPPTTALTLPPPPPSPSQPRVTEPTTTSSNNNNIESIVGGGPGGDALLNRLVATVAENHNAAAHHRPGSPNNGPQQCATCVLFKSSRDELLSHVSSAFDEVRRLRHQYDVCKERLAEVEGSGAAGGEGANYQLQQHVALLEDRCNAMQERMRLKENKAQAMETQVQSAKAIVRENADLRNQRDQLVQRVRELEGQMDRDIEAAEDAAECKIASLVGVQDPSSSACEAELKELRRLRVLMRFSELKKDSDRLQDVYRYAEELEAEIDRLRKLHAEDRPTPTMTDNGPTAFEADVLQATNNTRAMPVEEGEEEDAFDTHKNVQSPRQSNNPQSTRSQRSARQTEDIPHLHANPVGKSNAAGSTSARKQQLAPLPPSPSTRGPTTHRNARPQSSGGTSSVAWLLGLVREQRSGGRPGSSGGRSGGIPSNIASSPHQHHYLGGRRATTAATSPPHNNNPIPQSSSRQTRPNTAGIPTHGGPTKDGRL